MREKIVKLSQSAFASYLLAILIGISLNIVFNCFFGFSKVSGVSMSPTLKNNQIIMVKKQLIYNDFKEKDIISFKSHYVNEKNKNMSFVKRIIATEGQTVKIEDNKVFINDVLLEELYLPEDINTYGEIETVVPVDTYFVMGDNRENSMDSRDPTVGMIDKKDINGIMIQFNNK